MVQPMQMCLRLTLTRRPLRSGCSGMYNFKQPFKSGRTPDPKVDGYAHHAAYGGDLELLDEVLKTKGRAAFCRMGVHQWTPLMVAAYAGHAHVVTYLVEHGLGALEERDASLRTALHWATKHGHTHVVALLIENGAEVDRLDDGQRSPLMYAAYSSNTVMMNCLLGAGADADIGDCKLCTPLHVVCGDNNASAGDVELLLTYGACPDLPDLHGRSCLHLASAANRADVVGVLLGLGGANPYIRDDDGLTPERLAKTLSTQQMLKACPYQAHQVKRLRVLIAMESTGDDSSNTDTATASGSEPMAASATIVDQRRRACPARPLPSVAFHCAATYVESRRKAAEVLEHGVRHLRRDMFVELCHMLWPWETGVHSQAWG